MDICQKSLNEISLGRDFKLSVGGLNNYIPYTVQEILQSTWSWQNRDFIMELNAEAR